MSILWVYPKKKKRRGNPAVSFWTLSPNGEYAYLTWSSMPAGGFEKNAE